ncbi:hypothetical protein U0868_00415 [Kluyvera ascorbata]|uniref:hypothetical protein n=1 Tax=Kluyvera ascorbata TaxID=51288 RepID=UPI002ABB4D1F|nr:hypothetical protein [Kluyvera ascorbata]MDZ4030020.1 hypothetical protein [Kluyvera ascorbata]
MEDLSFKKKLSVSFIAMLLAASSVQAKKILEPQVGPWVQFTGKGYQFCDTMLKELNRFDYSQVTGSMDTCATELVIPHFKQLKEPPWQKLDPEQYRPLLRRIFSEEFEPPHIRLFEKGFYQLEERRTVLTREEEEKIEQRIDKFITDGRYLRVWRMPFPSWLEESARNQNMPVTPLIFIQTAQFTGKGYADFIASLCKGIPLSPLKISSGALYLVNESLDGPDPRTMIYIPQDKYSNPVLTIFSGTLRHIIRSNNKIYMYRGIPHFASVQGPTFVSSGKREWLNENYCQIN